MSTAPPIETATPERSIRDMSRAELDEHLQQLAVTAGELRFQLEQHLKGNDEALTLLDQLRLCTEKRLDAWCALGAHSSLSTFTTSSVSPR